VRGRARTYGVPTFLRAWRFLFSLFILFILSTTFFISFRRTECVAIGGFRVVITGQSDSCLRSCFLATHCLGLLASLLTRLSLGQRAISFGWGYVELPARESGALVRANISTLFLFAVESDCTFDLRLTCLPIGCVDSSDHNISIFVVLESDVAICLEDTDSKNEERHRQALPFAFNIPCPWL